MTNNFGDRQGGALVIGGSGAIGRAIAEQLAALGTDVVVGYRSRRETADAAVAAVTVLGRRGYALTVDLDADADRTAQAVTDAAELVDGLHTVVVAASPPNSQFYVGQIPANRYAEQLSSDAVGTYNVAMAALPHLRRSRGSIVAVTTVANRGYVLRDVLSTAPKAANEALLRAIAAEEGKYGVRANAVGVGILDEGMTERLIASGDIRPGDLDHALTRIPMREFGKADDIAAVVGFLASHGARYVTGQWIDVDGGYSL